MGGEWGTKRTRLETLQMCGRKPRRIARVSIADGLQAARMTINAAVFDSKKCAIGIEGLKAYRREWDSERRTYKPDAYKDWAEHIGSAFRYLGLAWKEVIPPKPKKEPPKEVEYTVTSTGVVQANVTVMEAVEAMKRRRNKL
jgi:hypothetical protein